MNDGEKWMDLVGGGIEWQWRDGVGIGVGGGRVREGWKGWKGARVGGMEGW